MAIGFSEKSAKNIGSWQEIFVPTYSKRIQNLKKFNVQTPGICLERARAEMKAYEQYKHEPTVIQRARIFETYLKDKTIFILDDELIVGNINSKVRGSTVSGFIMANLIDKELDDPVKGFDVTQWNRHLILPEERKELREVLLPYFKGKTIGDFIMRAFDDELREKADPATSSCPHIPRTNTSMRTESGMQMPNIEKVLHKGLKGIRQEVEWYMAQLDEPYLHYGVQAKKDFYQAVLITLDAAMAYAKRYADLARQMAAKDPNPKRKIELERIAKVCEWVPANPAQNWWEAVQSVWMIQIFMQAENIVGAKSFGRFDQYMYPYYKKSIIDEKTMSRDDALELLECFWVKTASFTLLRGYDFVRDHGAGYSISQTVLLGGQTRDGKDACNEVTMLCLDAEEQVGGIQPETAFRIWEGTPDKYLRRTAEILRLGRGKPKYFGDREAIRMVAKAYPNLTVEDWRDYAVQGCVELNLPHITKMHNVECALVGPKILELVMNNGKCALCGKQIGPLTGDPRTFESIEAVRQAFREQIFYWMKYSAKAVKITKERLSQVSMSPFSSALTEGPLQKGLDVVQGGAWYTIFGLWLSGLADTADSLGVIDRLIYREKMITWDQLLEATRANWNGFENLRQLCINHVPKYGNDDDYADSWAAFVFDTWQDSIDWINTQKELIPYFGGMYLGASMINVGNVGFGLLVSGLPNGHIYPNPIADTISPVQGMDRNGPTAVLRSVSKLPSHRLALGTCLNQRLSPQLVATDRDIDNLVSYLRTMEELGVYHIQINIISSEALRKAMNEPEKNRDLMVRVASYCAYFVDLTKEQQMDIINRTEQLGW